MTQQEIQLILSSNIGDAYWMKQKKTLRIKFGSYTKSYLQFKHNLITTIQKSKIWKSKNYKKFLYEFTIGKDSVLNSLKESTFFDLIKRLGDLDELGFALLVFDNGTFTTNRQQYNLSIGRQYSKKLAINFSKYIKTKFRLSPTICKNFQSRGYYLYFPTYDTPKIAKMLIASNCKAYQYKIAPPETISKTESRYKDIPNNLRGHRAYDIVRTVKKLTEN